MIKKALFLFLFIYVYQSAALLEYPAPTSAASTEPEYRYTYRNMRPRRYLLITEHARQVQENVAKYHKEQRMRDLEEKRKILEKFKQWKAERDNKIAMELSDQKKIEYEMPEKEHQDPPKSQMIQEGQKEHLQEMVHCTDPDHTLRRIKRDWFATLSPEEYQDRVALLHMSIKKKHSDH